MRQEKRLCSVHHQWENYFLIKKITLKAFFNKYDISYLYFCLFKCEHFRSHIAKKISLQPRRDKFYFCFLNSIVVCSSIQQSLNLQSCFFIHFLFKAHMSTTNTQEEGEKVMFDGLVSWEKACTVKLRFSIFFPN